MSDAQSDVNGIAPQPLTVVTPEQLRHETLSLALILFGTLALATLERHALVPGAGYVSSLVLLVLSLWHKRRFGVAVRFLPARGDRWTRPLGLSIALMAIIMLAVCIPHLRSRPGPSILALLHLLVLVPLSEELYFRGLLLAHLRKTFNAVQATLLCSALFAALHFPLEAATATGFLSVIACVFVLRTGTLAYALQLHIAWNALAEMPEVDVSSSRFYLAIFASAMIILLAIARLKTPRSVAHADAS
jgi:membrane protease YdiL (CAAX protease family)